MKKGHHCLLFALAMLASINHAAAQGTAFTCRPAFTYQGRVTDNGTNFTGTGQFKFALLTPTNTSSQAIGVAVMAGAPQDFSVTEIVVVDAGGGYVSPPTVTVSPPQGGGATATAVATVSGGVVTAITLTGGGSGYWVPP